MKRAANQPTGELYLYAGIYLREMRTPDAGTIIPQHRHRWAHLSYLAAGGVRVWRDDRLVGDFWAPDAIRIEAGALHRFETLAPDTLILCIHATDAAEPEIEAEHQLELEC